MGEMHYSSEGLRHHRCRIAVVGEGDEFALDDVALLFE